MTTSTIYVFAAPHGVKVGITRGDPEMRRQGVQAAAGVAIKTVALFECQPERIRGVEQKAHYALARWRGFGEWFSCTPEEAVAAVREALRPIAVPKSAPVHRRRPAAELAAEVAALVDGGETPELAALRVLGGRASSRQIASLLHGEPPSVSESISIGRRLRGLETRGYLARWGAEWALKADEVPA